jgi:hypothetical protein
MKDSSCLLKNLYTQKTFQPSSLPNSGVILWQQPLGRTVNQYWEFIKQPDNSSMIRLDGSDLYITITSDENNSAIVLMPKQESDNQLWRMVRQKPMEIKG